MKQMLTKEIKHTILYSLFGITFVIPFYYSSGSVISYGSCSGSNFLTSYGSGSGSTRQKVTVPTVPLPVPVSQHWFHGKYKQLGKKKEQQARHKTYCLI